ncbi:MAG: hypothetical protein AB1938_02930 [Myxococcota bacterium]
MRSIVAAVVAVVSAGCGYGKCTNQSCADWGGQASKSLTACYASGVGSSPDEFWLLDSAGKEFYRCERPADDNDGCGVALIVAKESFCAAAP